MYTKRELKRAAGIIRQIAREDHVTEEEVRRDMKEAMDAGRNNPDLAVQAKWVGFEYAGDEPTLEEFILWMAGQVR
jgi:predicted DNA-binding transcriptional regulator